MGGTCARSLWYGCGRQLPLGGSWAPERKGKGNGSLFFFTLPLGRPTSAEWQLPSEATGVAEGPEKSPPGPRKAAAKKRPTAKAVKRSAKKAAKKVDKKLKKAAAKKRSG